MIDGPFPGMDAYIESGEGWRSFHTHLLVSIVGALQPYLLPRRIASLRERTPLGSFAPPARVEAPQRLGLPPHLTPSPAPLATAMPEIVSADDSQLPQRFVEIRDLGDGRVLTAIEVLNPWNKTCLGREEYAQRQRDYLASPVHLVEIDLLRQGVPAVAIPAASLPASDYRVCVHRSGSEQFELVRFGLRDPLPVVAVPVDPADTDVPLDLPAAFTKAYRGEALAFSIDYDAEPEALLNPDELAWARERIAAWRKGMARSDDA